jgi:LysM repeat protein
MKNIITSLVLAFGLSIGIVQANIPDSVGYELNEGKVLVVYKVGEKETLFSIAQKYATSMYEILQLNPGAEEGLRFGQILKVPYTKPFDPNWVKKAAESSSPGPSSGRLHKVQAKETVFSISRQYGISPDELRRWNRLANDNIRIGQELVVGQAQTAVSSAQRNENQSQPVVTASASTNFDRANYEIERRPVNDTGKNTKVSEKGIATVIENAGETAQFLALHKTAAVGTIIQVRNPMNNLSIFARVIGKLPDTGDNDKLVIKLSKSAYERLGALDKRFLVELSFIE